MISKNINNNVYLVRKELGLSMAKFGEIISLSGPSINRIEKGERSLTERSIKDICREFDVNEEWLRYGTGDMFNDRSDMIDLMKFIGNIIDSPEKNEKIRKLLSLIKNFDDDEIEAMIFLGQQLIEQRKKPPI